MSLPVIRSVTLSQPAGYQPGAPITVAVSYSGSNTTAQALTESGSVLTTEGQSGTSVMSGTLTLSNLMDCTVTSPLKVTSDNHTGSATLAGTAASSAGPGSATVTVTDRATGEKASAPVTWTVLAAAADAGGAPVLGFNSDVNISGGFPAMASLLGVPAIHGAKMFFQSIPSSRPVPPPGVTSPLFCTKAALPLTATSTAAFASLCKSLQAGDRVTFWQEAEHSGYTQAQMQAGYATLSQVFDANAPAGAKFVQCLMSWSASGFSSHGSLSSWVMKKADGSALGEYGFDTYPSTSTSTAGSVLDAALTQLQAVFPQAAYSITECNYTTDLSAGITYAAGSAPFISDAWKWAQAHSPAMFILYYLSSHGVPWPPDQATITVLQQIASQAA